MGLAQRIFAESLGVSDQRLLLVFQLIFVELADFRPVLGALRGAFAGLAPFEQRLDQLFVLAERLLDAHERLRSAAIVWIELDQLGVHLFRAVVARGRFVQAGGARQVLLHRAL